MESGAMEFGDLPGGAFFRLKEHDRTPRPGPILVKLRALPGDEPGVRNAVYLQEQIGCRVGLAAHCPVVRVSARIAETSLLDEIAEAASGVIA